ncbi:MAG: hypothetical protein HKN23_01725 [Verrucomicrobiales bacterium]|nr:hypothetical protein [Verrucomicrobiales bacterium]
MTFLFLSSAILFAGCETNPAQSSGSKAPARMYVPANEGVPAIARREIIRRQERMRAADTAALRAGQQQAAGDTEGAIQSYKQALTTLPATE